MLADKRAVAVRVTKETLDPETDGVQHRHPAHQGRARAGAQDASSAPTSAEPLCRAPAGPLRRPRPRDRSAGCWRTGWRRNGVTAFELLHRPDLVEKLEASGVELQHAIQKIAVPESQATGQAVHDLMRPTRGWSNRPSSGSSQDGRKGTLPRPDEGARRRGGPAAGRRAGPRLPPGRRDLRRPGPRHAAGATRSAACSTWPTRAPTRPAPGAMVLVVIEQPLAEILASPHRPGRRAGPGPGPGRQPGRRDPAGRAATRSRP